MALAYGYADQYAASYEVEQDHHGLRIAREALRAALTEALKNKQDLYTSQERVQNSPESVHIAQPTAMPFVPWSKEAEMLESWTNKTVDDTKILARGRFHAFKGEDGEPDDWEWFEAGTECEDGCVDAVIVRADSIQATQPVREPCKTLCELCVKRGHSGCANTAQTTPIVVAQPVQASTDFHILSITTAYEQGVGKGHQAFKRGNDIETPYAVPSDCAKAWDYGYEEGKIQASRLGDKT
jgi:hypothetical protein